MYMIILRVIAIKIKKNKFSVKISIKKCMVKHSRQFKARWSNKREKDRNTWVMENSQMLTLISA